MAELISRIRATKYTWSAVHSKQSLKSTPSPAGSLHPADLDIGGDFLEGTIRTTPSMYRDITGGERLQGELHFLMHSLGNIVNLAVHRKGIKKCLLLGNALVIHNPLSGRVSTAVLFGFNGDTKKLESMRQIS